MAEQSVYGDGEDMPYNQPLKKQKRSSVSASPGEYGTAAAPCSIRTYSSVQMAGPELHRKLMPIFLTWAAGDGHGLNVIETLFGKIGNLVYGENTNPFARYSVIAQGEQLHISTWPAETLLKNDIRTVQNILHGICRWHS